MKHLSDIEIAQHKELKHIKEIAAKLGIDEDDLELFENTKLNYLYL